MDKQGPEWGYTPKPFEFHGRMMYKKCWFCATWTDPEIEHVLSHVPPEGLQEWICGDCKEGLATKKANSKERRRELIRMLKDGPLTVSEAAEELGVVWAMANRDMVSLCEHKFAKETEVNGKKAVELREIDGNIEEMLEKYEETIRKRREA